MTIADFESRLPVGSFGQEQHGVVGQRAGDGTRCRSPHGKLVRL